ncbi:MAG: hypothetical protein IJ174_05370 [Clostridia bacterium]|nr:hypothetical protein [Clostridia bacterium]
MPFLQENGLWPEDDAPDAEEDSKAEPEALADIDQMTIAVPAQEFTVNQLKNLTFMLYAKQILINRMTLSDLLQIPDSLIEKIQTNPPETQDEFIQMLDDFIPLGLTGFDFRDGKFSIVFPFDNAEPTRWTTYAGLLNRIVDAAKKATRVFPEKAVPDDQNEKYLAHTWLIRLGYSGKAQKADREILLKHLNGYCAFRSADKMENHKTKYAAIRKERKLAEQEAAVQEVFSDEVNGDDE